MIKTKAKGTRSEKKAIKLLEATGWYCVRSAGSFGLFDIIAIHPRIPYVRCIQVKTNKKASKGEIELIKEFPLPRNFVKELWVFVDYEREPLIEYL